MSSLPSPASPPLPSLQEFAKPLNMSGEQFEGWCLAPNLWSQYKIVTHTDSLILYIKANEKFCFISEKTCHRPSHACTPRPPRNINVYPFAPCLHTNTYFIIFHYRMLNG